MKNLLKLATFIFAFGAIFVGVDSANAQTWKDIRKERKEYRKDVRDARKEYRKDVREARREYRRDTGENWNRGRWNGNDNTWYNRGRYNRNRSTWNRGRWNNDSSRSRYYYRNGRRYYRGY